MENTQSTYWFTMGQLEPLGDTMITKMLSSLREEELLTFAKVYKLDINTSLLNKSWLLVGEELQQEVAVKALTKIREASFSQPINHLFWREVDYDYNEELAYSLLEGDSYEFRKIILTNMSLVEMKSLVRVNNIPVRTNCNKISMIEDILKHIDQRKMSESLQVTEVNYLEESKEVVHTGSPEAEKLHLITNYVWEHPILTTKKDDSGHLYVVGLDRKIRKVADWVLNDASGDTAVSPKHFHLLAKELRCDYDSATFADVCSLFVDKKLEGEWTKLHHYLPKEEDEYTL